MISKKQISVLAFPYSKYSSIICDGAIRSGKTSIMSVAFVEWIMRNFDKQNFIILGNTSSSAYRNVIKPLTEMTYIQKRYKMKYNHSSHVLEIRQGNKVNVCYVFGANNIRSQDPIQGLTAAGCFVDEAALCNKMAVDQALARCSVENSRYWFSCNPESPLHWFYREWILRSYEQNALYLHFTLEDNPALSEETKERYRRQYTGVFYDRYILGLWTQAEGLIYPMYNEALEERYTGKYTDYCLSIDYGTQNAFVCQKWVRDNEHIWHMIEEYRYSGRETGIQKTDQQYVQDICEFVGDYKGGQIVTIVDPSAASFIVALRKQTYDKNKVFKVIDANNDVKNGIMNTATALQMGYVMIGRNCKACIQEFSSYVWDGKSNEDKPLKEADHSMDALRYFVMTKRAYQEYVPYTPIF